MASEVQQVAPILEVRQLSMDFGGLRAMDRLDLEIHQGEIVALIGPNGAGKTTFFNCITGIYNPTGGDVLVRPPGGKSKTDQRPEAQPGHPDRPGTNLSEYPPFSADDRA